MLSSMPKLPLLWLSDRQAINPANIVWLFRGTHGELEITFTGGKQIAFNERDLTDDARALLLPESERMRSIGPA
jgi:hypothetical protein